MPMNEGEISGLIENRKSKIENPLILVLFTALALLVSGFCSHGAEAPLKRFEFKHPAMGTLFFITLYAPGSDKANEAAGAAFQRIEALEDIMSDYEADSELMRLCDQPCGQPVPVSKDLFDVLESAQKISAMSGGCFDVTVGPYVRLWRFARKRKVLPTEAQLAEARQAVGYQKLRLDARTRTVTLLVPHMRLDLGGIAKGYAADDALKLLRGRGIERALVAASGDIAIGKPPPGKTGWKVGIAAIDAKDQEITTLLLLHDAGISTSGDSEQFIEIGGARYSHILNPATGLGLTNRIQASVIAPNATMTDALATTVCVLGAQRGLALVNRLPRTAALILIQDEDRKQSIASRRFWKIPQTSTGNQDIQATEK
ncbi:MAG TPA: FAD:protein FMN transferase [Verrucomicrobiae bacterium]|nr:FAD:protein FMN transferase [Verrucomicrobiae bacterium]